MKIDRMNEHDEARHTRKFTLFPEFASLDRSGYTLQINVLWWNVQMAMAGRRNWEHALAELIRMLPLKK